MKPVLVLQLQRLGDLILTFPLLQDLRSLYPQSPIWVAAESNFFSGLAPHLPNILFFSPDQLPELSRHEYEAIINLSHRPEAATFMATARSNLKLGQIRESSGLRVLGYWHLYRAALTRNNRHNSFHWSDLNRMDLGIPLPSAWQTPRRGGSWRRIGLFIGASEPDKRPGTAFWGALARRLVHERFKPIFLGGPEEAAEGGEIAIKSRLPNANLCGKTTIPQLIGILKSLDLLVTPDTGPMHLADWLGVPVLNLSMGTVHARETGPSSPGQWVLRSGISCSGCWECPGDRLLCKKAFKPSAVACLISALHIGSTNFEKNPGLELLRVFRDSAGLHQLEPVAATISCRPGLERFWQNAFLHFFDESHKPALIQSATGLADSFPALFSSLHDNFGKMLASFSASIRKRQTLPEAFWHEQPWHSRLFAGHVQMSLQNDNFSQAAMRSALDRIGELHEIFAARA